MLCNVFRSVEHDTIGKYCFFNWLYIYERCCLKKFTFSPIPGLLEGGGGSTISGISLRWQVSAISGIYIPGGGVICHLRDFDFFSFFECIIT